MVLWKESLWCLRRHFLLLSPDPLAFLYVRRRSGSYSSERFCRNLESYFTSSNNPCTADTSVVLSISTVASDFLWSPCITFFVITCSMSGILLHFNSNFFLFSAICVAQLQSHSIKTEGCLALENCVLPSSNYSTSVRLYLSYPSLPCRQLANQGGYPRLLTRSSFEC